MLFLKSGIKVESLEKNKQKKLQFCGGGGGVNILAFLESKRKVIQYFF